MNSETKLGVPSVNPPAVAETKAVIVSNGRETWVGKQIGSGWVIKERMGEGGMGDVYKCHHDGLDSDGVVKICTSNDIERFKREARAMMQLSKQKVNHVVQIYELVEDIPAIIMEMVPGCTLEDYLQKHKADLRKPYMRKRLLVLMRRIAKTLEETHRLHVLHRDLKPLNIMITNPDESDLIPSIIDWGLARIKTAACLTSALSLMGTPLYVAPEQLNDPENPTSRVDVFSFGVILYEILSGGEHFYDNITAGDGAMQAAIKVSEFLRDEEKCLRRLTALPPQEMIAVGLMIAPDPEVRLGNMGKVVWALSLLIKHYDNMEEKATQLTREVPALDIPPEPINEEVTEDVNADRLPAKRNYGLLAVLILLGLIAGLGFGWFLAKMRYSKQGGTDKPKNEMSASADSAKTEKVQHDAGVGTGTGAKHILPKPDKDAAPAPVSAANSGLTDEEIEKVYLDVQSECRRTDPNRKEFEKTPALEMVCIRTSLQKPSNLKIGQRILAIDELISRFCFPPRTTWDRPVDKECSNAKSARKGLFYWVSGDDARIYNRRISERSSRWKTHRDAFIAAKKQPRK